MKAVSVSLKMHDSRNLGIFPHHSLTSFLSQQVRLKADAAEQLGERRDVGQ